MLHEENGLDVTFGQSDDRDLLKVADGDLEHRPIAGSQGRVQTRDSASLTVVQLEEVELGHEVFQRETPPDHDRMQVGVVPAPDVMVEGNYALYRVPQHRHILERPVDELMEPVREVTDDGSNVAFGVNSWIAAPPDTCTTGEGSFFTKVATVYPQWQENHYLFGPA